MPTSHHVIRFRGSIAGLDEAGAVLRGLLDARHLATEPRYNVELAFEEIAANIVRHGSTTADVEVTVGFADDETTLTFEDDGVPFDPCARPVYVPPTSIDDAPVGGLGVMLVKSITTRMAYERTPDRRNRLMLAISSR